MKAEKNNPEMPRGAVQLARSILAAEAVGVVINPATPAVVLEEVLPEIDLVLVMTINPGFGRRHFVHTVLSKIRRVRQMIEQTNPACELEPNGGIDAATGPLGVAAGANVLVAESAISGDNGGVSAAMSRHEADTEVTSANMRIGIATDHGGFGLKEELVAQLHAAGHENVNFGARTLNADDDYPDVVVPLARAVVAQKGDRGLAICGSVAGASACANKVEGVRAILITPI
jgi:hypothetical protein